MMKWKRGAMGDRNG